MYGNHNTSCGIVILDKNKISGLNMIGTIPEAQRTLFGQNHDK